MYNLFVLTSPTKNDYAVVFIRSVMSINIIHFCEEIREVISTFWLKKTPKQPYLDLHVLKKKRQYTRKVGDGLVKETYYTCICF